jgi:endonuclease/exonuclease/phosphatase family metal-dependent hydrolase
MSEFILQSWNCFGAVQTALAFFRGRGVVDAERFLHHAVAATCESADVLCMQELWAAEALEFFGRRTHPHKDRDDNELSWRPLAFGGSGLGIASRHPFAKVNRRAFMPPHVGPERFARKGWLHARVRLARDVELDVINTHLQSGDGEDAAKVRARQLKELRALVDAESTGGRAVVVCGDLNVDGHAPHRVEREALEHAMRGFVDLGEQAGHSTFDPHRNVLAAREGAHAKPQRLDYVFFRASANGPALRVVDVRLALHERLPTRARSLFASDHAAIRVRLRIE